MGDRRDQPRGNGVRLPVLRPQFRLEPVVAWPVVPDGPTATPFVARSLAPYTLGRSNEYANVPAVSAVSSSAPGRRTSRRPSRTRFSPQIEAGIRTRLAAHERSLDPEAVLDLIVAPEATALLILARGLGYEIDVTSEFVPKALIDSTS